MAVGDRLFELRKAAGLSQEMLAEKLSVSRQTISKWESGVSTPDINNILAICSLFNVSTDYMLIKDASSEENKSHLRTKRNEGTSLSEGFDEDVTQIQNKASEESIRSAKKSTRNRWLWIVCSVALVILMIVLFQNKSKNVIQEASKSVLYLELYNRKGEMLGSGSGFLVDENTLVTNYHVIESVYRIVAKSADEEKTLEITTVLGYDIKRDLASLEVSEPLGLAPLELADSDAVAQGDEIFAIGYPLGLKNTLSDGIVSAVYEEDNNWFIQFSAPISSGSSGGVLLNKFGNVIGVTCASYIDGQNLNLAIPSNDIQNLLAHQKKVNLSELYEKTLTGYAAYSESKEIDYCELCDNHAKYEGELITIIGYVIDAQQRFDIFEFALAPDSTYQVKIQNGEEDHDLLTNYINDSQIVICQTGLKLHTTFENNAMPSIGDYVIICGYSQLLLGNIIFQDIRLVSVLS